MLNRRSRFKIDFPQLGDRAYLNTGAEGIPPPGSLMALGDYMRAKNMGAEGRPELYEADRLCKEQLSKFLGVSEQEVAILGNASEALNRLCNSIEWKAGDEVVIDDLEFPSNVLPWLQLKARGVKLKIVKSRDWQLLPEDFERVVGSKTKLVSVSHVSYMSGARLDIDRIAQIAHSVEAIFSLDATQSLGRIPVPMKGIDYLVCSTYKWLLAPHGGGILFCSSDLLEKLKPCTVGWWSVPNLFSPKRFEVVEFKPSASRFELGMPNFLISYGLRSSLAFLERAGVERVDRELEPVCDYLIEELSDLGVDLMTPKAQHQRAGLVSFSHPRSEEIARLLANNRIYVWGGDGRVRVSVHLYNDMDEAQMFVKSLKKALRIQHGH